MNKLTEEQIKKVSVANLTNFDNTYNVYYIKKYSKPIFKAGSCYIIRISNELVNNTDHIITTNWNNGVAPKNNVYKAYVGKVIGKMIYCDCLEYDFENKKDLSEIFSGWFDINLIEQLAELY